METFWYSLDKEQEPTLTIQLWHMGSKNVSMGVAVTFFVLCLKTMSRNDEEPEIVSKTSILVMLFVFLNVWTLFWKKVYHISSIWKCCSAATSRKSQKSRTKILENFSFVVCLLRLLNVLILGSKFIRLWLEFTKFKDAICWETSFREKDEQKK